MVESPAAPGEWASRSLGGLDVVLVCSDGAVMAWWRRRLVEAGADDRRIACVERIDAIDPGGDVAVLACVDEAERRRIASGDWRPHDLPLVVVFDRLEGGLDSQLVEQGVEDALSREEATPATLHRAIVYATERHAWRRELQRHNERLRSVIDSNLDGMLVISGDGVIRFANVAAERLIGRPAESLIGSEFGFPIVPGEHAEIELRTSDGSMRVAELRVADFRFDYADALLVTVRDVTEQKAAEATARRYHERVERLTSELSRTEERERRRLARVLHDEVQQSLVAAKMTIDLARKLGDRREADRELSQAAEYIDEATQMTRSLTAELTPTILDDLGLAPALDWLCRIHRERFGLRVRLDSESDLRLRDKDLRAFLFQSVRELLFNAVKHAGGASVVVEAGRLDDGRLRLVVADDGPGFDPEALDDREDDLGGFGLFQLRQRLAQLDGALEIQSRPGGGSRFEITVADGSGAFAAASTEARAPAAAEPEPTERAVRVLIIDDSRAVRRLFTRLLDAEPSVDVVGAASTGAEGLRLAQETRPDAVLTDVSLPDMSGVDVVRQLVADRPETRVIGLSMHEPEDVEAAMLAAGATAYLRKDRPLEQVIAALTRERRG